MQVGRCVPRVKWLTRDGIKEMGGKGWIGWDWVRMRERMDGEG